MIYKYNYCCTITEITKIAVLLQCIIYIFNLEKEKCRYTLTLYTFILNWNHTVFLKNRNSINYK